MKIYLLTQNDSMGYDTYDAIIVCAKNEQDAKMISPSGHEFEEDHSKYGLWAKTLDGIKCEEIGTANKTQKRGIILASFNAG